MQPANSRLRIVCEIASRLACVIKGRLGEKALQRVGRFTAFSLVLILVIPITAFTMQSPKDRAQTDIRYTAQTEGVADNASLPASTLDSGCFPGVVYETQHDFHDDMETKGCTDYDSNYEIYQVGASCDDSYLYFMWEIAGVVGSPENSNFSFWAWIDVDDNTATGDAYGMDYLVDYSVNDGEIVPDWAGLHDASSTDWPPTMLYQLASDDYCPWGTYLEVRISRSHIQGHGVAPKIHMGVDVNFFSEPLNVCMDDVWPFHIDASCVGEVECSVTIEVAGMVAIEEVTCFEPGDTLYRTIWFRDSTGNLADPQSKTVSLHVRPGEPDEYTENITELFTRPTVGVYVHTGPVPSEPVGHMILEVKATFEDGCEAEAKKEYEVATDCRAGCSIEIEFSGGKTCFTKGDTLTRTVRFKDRSGALADPSYMEITWGYGGFNWYMTSDFSKVSTGVWEYTETIAPDTARGTWSLGVYATFPDHCEATAREYYEIQGASLCTKPDPPSHDLGDVAVGEQMEWSFQITNCGSRSNTCESKLEWKITDDQTWITKIEPTSRTTTTTENITVTIDTTGLTPWKAYEGNITITSNAGTKTGTIKMYVVKPFGLSLRIEDAIEGVPVNKVPPTYSSGAPLPLVDITTEITNQGKTDEKDVPVTLNIPDDIFGEPVTYLRKDNSDELTEVSHTDLDSGSYAVTTDLSASKSKQIVWRFTIPEGLSSQDVKVSAKFEESQPKTGTIRILADGQADAIIITNRKLLYEMPVTCNVTSVLADMKTTDEEILPTMTLGADLNLKSVQEQKDVLKNIHSDCGISVDQSLISANTTVAELQVLVNKAASDGVTSLLQRLFTEAQGPPSSNSPVGVIYYVDRYNPDFSDWDYVFDSDDKANDISEEILKLIRNWYSWGGDPSYLLIVGDDDVIPFRRYDSYGVPIPTDTRYADMRGFLVLSQEWGDHWSKGDVELAVGRLLGATTEDMLKLLDEGVNTENGKTGNVVMASVDGWTLDGVPKHFRDKGFEVRNDDEPASEVCTIDVEAPWEGGEVAWCEAFEKALSDNTGMDLLYIGGHGAYTHAELPGTCSLWANNMPNEANTWRFQANHPIVVFSGCNICLPGRYTGDPNFYEYILYRIIEQGARTVIGATYFTYFDSDPHKTRWGEQVMQRTLSELVASTGSQSTPIGKALLKAKRAYSIAWHTAWTLRMGGALAQGHRSLTEYNLFGVPWAFIHYPPTVSMTAAPASQEPEEPAFTTAEEPLVGTGENKVYSRTFTADIESYDAETETQGDTTYDLFSIKGGDVACLQGAPILPYVTAYKLALPLDGKVTGVELVDTKSKPVGTYNIPIANIMPASQGGLTYTTDTDIDFSFPDNEHLVQYDMTNEGLLLTVFPIQHNPATGETTFYNHFEVRVTYETPVDVVVTEFTTDEQQYIPGETISTGTHIENLSDTNATLTAKMEITNIRGEIVATQTSEEFSVPSGGSSVLPLDWNGELDDGAYTVQISLYNQQGIAGHASTRIRVMGGSITALTVPSTLTTGEEGIFQVSFANYRSDKVNGNVSLAIHSSEGALVEKLPSQPVTVEGRSTGTATFTWTPVDIASSRYNVLATVVVDDKTYGPTSRTFVLEGQGDGSPVPPPQPPQPPQPTPPLPGNPPVVSFTSSPASPVVKQPTTFDGSASYHPAGKLVFFEWNFGDGGESSGIIVTHTYMSAGTYTVSLTATGNDGVSATYSTVVQVMERQQGLPIWIWIVIGGAIVMIAFALVWRWRARI